MVSEPTRRLIRKRAKFLCEYCHSPEYLSPDRFTIDHIMPQSLGGSDELDNLALACHRCNERHYNFIVATDPKTQEQVALFNPRQQEWSEHFIWTKDGIKTPGFYARWVLWNKQTLKGSVDDSNKTFKDITFKLK